MLSFLTALLVQRAAHATDEAGTFWMPPQASTYAADVDFTYYFIYWIDVAFFVVLMGAMIYFAIQYRQKGANDKTLDLKGSHRVELAWAILPCFLLAPMFLLGFQTYMQQVVPPADALQVQVRAQKWQWNYSYPELGIENTSVLVVPQGRPVMLTMSSSDVLHSFFVPDFRLKKDVIPGRYSVVWFQADDVFDGNSARGNMPALPAEQKGLLESDDAGLVHTALDNDGDGYTDGLGRGEHQVFCTEYCGTDHSRMYSRIKVLPPEEFEAWVTGMTTVDLASLSPAERGERIYKRYGCAGCHSVDGSRLVGPTFQGLWGRQENIEGMGAVTVDADYISESIRVPGAKIVEGYPNQMPPYQGQLDTEQIDDVIAYLQTLQ